MNQCVDGNQLRSKDVGQRVSNLSHVKHYMSPYTSTLLHLPFLNLAFELPLFASR